MGQSGIRSVAFSPAGESSTIRAEVSTVARIRRRGGREEFLAPQRLGFELLIAVSTGQTIHGVDFTGYPLSSGDVLWVHAGQVQQWGNLEEIEGLVLLFAAHALPPAVQEMLRGAGSLARNYWAGAADQGSPLADALDSLERASQRTRLLRPELKAEILTHQLSATLLELSGTETPGSAAPGPEDEIFRWFSAEIERRFRELHTVLGYATRLGYSARTLNRAAQANAGVTAKQLVDQRVILEAKRLLAHDSAPVASVAAELGFDDPANFSKYFTQRTGTTPAAFRRAVRSGG